MNPLIFSHYRALPDKKLKKALSPDYRLSYSVQDSRQALVLDNFDGEFQNNHLLLLQTKKTLILINSLSGTIHEQNGILAHKCLSELPSGPVAHSLKNISQIRALLPLAEITFSVERRNMLDDEDKTVARIQSFSFKTNDTSAHLSICTPIRGYTEAYSRLQTEISTLQTKTNENEQTVLRLLGLSPIHYSAKPQIPLQADAPICQSSATIISTFIEIARQNEQGILSDLDTEFLHDYRVSLRKVRSVISLFKGVYSDEETAFLKQEFADIMQSTGRLRDLDVYLLDRDEYFSLVPATTHEGLEILFDSFEVEREEVFQNVCTTIKSRAYKKKIKSLAKGFKKQTWATDKKAEIASLEFACKVILKRYNKVCSIARTIDATTEDETVHELRIHCKKLRYLMEFFTPLFPKKEVKTLIKTLKILQDNLGRFNDYSVQQESLAAFLADNPLKGADKVKVAESIGALTAMLNLRQQNEKALVMDNFSRFDSTGTRLLFTKIFSI